MITTDYIVSLIGRGGLLRVAFISTKSFSLRVLRALIAAYNSGRALSSSFSH